MKKRVFSLLLTLIMVVCMLPQTAVFASGEPVTHSHRVCADSECTDAGHTDIVWTAWTADNALPNEEGSYYLTKDVTLTSIATVASNITLCLNGHTVDLNGNNITVTSGSFTLTDCGASGTVTGGRGASVYSNNSGGAVAVTGGVFNLYAGTITGSTARFGGGVYVTNSTFNMYGGTISGNRADSGNVNNSYGGGVYLASGGNFNMYAGTVSENYAKNSGGGICSDSPSATTALYGGAITNNTASDNGGGVYLYNNDHIMGGSMVISGNTAGSAGGGVYVNVSRLEVEGPLVVTGNTVQSSANNLYIERCGNFNIFCKLSSDFNIGITFLNSSIDIYCLYPVDNIEDYIVSDDLSREIARDGNSYYTKRATLHTISVDEATENGSVISDKTEAYKRETVTLTVTPDKYYELESLTVMQGENEVPVNSDNTFTMPNGAVTVTASFKLSPHECSYPNGICNICGAFESASDTDSDGYYEIGNAGQLFWFAQHVNSGATDANAILTANIDLEGRPWTPIGSTGAYEGSFNGKNKTISGFKLDITEAGDWGFWKSVSNSSIENVTVNGQVTVNCADTVNYGLICRAKDAVISNVHSGVNLSVIAGNSANKIGGVAGYAMLDSADLTIDSCTFSGKLRMNSSDVDCLAGIITYVEAGGTASITNCGFYGEITTDRTEAEQTGGIMAYYRGSGLTMKNCLSVGTITAQDTSLSGAIMGVLRQHSGANTLVTNNYFLNGVPFGNSSNSDDITDNYGQQSANNSAAQVTAQQLSSGEVAYKLGSAWGQTLGSDAYPFPGGKTVNYGFTTCDEKEQEKIYTNEAAFDTKPGHSFGDAEFDFIACTAKIMCSECSHIPEMNCELSSSWDSEKSEIKVTAASEYEGKNYEETLTISLSVENGTITITNSSANEDETLDMFIVVAAYSDSKMTGCQIISDVTGLTKETLSVAGDTLKIFFFNSDSYAPLFVCAQI